MAPSSMSTRSGAGSAAQRTTPRKRASGLRAAPPTTSLRRTQRGGNKAVAEKMAAPPTQAATLDGYNISEPDYSSFEHSPPPNEHVDKVAAEMDLLADLSRVLDSYSGRLNYETKNMDVYEMLRTARDPPTEAEQLRMDMASLRALYASQWAELSSLKKEVGESNKLIREVLTENNKLVREVRTQVRLPASSEVAPLQSRSLLGVATDQGGLQQGHKHQEEQGLNGQPRGPPYPELRVVDKHNSTNVADQRSSRLSTSTNQLHSYQDKAQTSSFDAYLQRKRKRQGEQGADVQLGADLSDSHPPGPPAPAQRAAASHSNTNLVEERIPRSPPSANRPATFQRNTQPASSHIDISNNHIQSDSSAIVSTTEDSGSSIQPEYLNWKVRVYMNATINAAMARNDPELAEALTRLYEENAENPEFQDLMGRLIDQRADGNDMKEIGECLSRVRRSLQDHPPGDWHFR